MNQRRFGFGLLSVLPGLAIGLALVLLLALAVRDIARGGERREGWAAVVALTVGILASLGSIGLARTGFGIDTSKASRYAEVAMLLLPAAWLLAQARLERLAAPRLRLGATVLVGALLIAPFLNDFDYYRTYYGAQRKVRLEGRQCVQRYLLKQGDGTCLSTYPIEGLGPRIERARELRLSFAQEMAQ